jgi:hypothetical protein
MSTPTRSFVQELARQAALTKQARCWDGYEPVPGKDPYSDDSCRPKGSGKKKKQPMAKRADIARNSLPFALGGAALGGLGGAAYNQSRGGDKKRPMWRDVLTGVGAGAGAGFAGNLAGNASYDNDLGFRAGLGLKGDQTLALLSALGGGIGGGILGGGFTEGAADELTRGQGEEEKEKQAWEVEDESGGYSNWPLQYASYLTPPPNIPANHPDHDREFATQTLQRATKKLPADRKLHWVDFDAKLGERPWYNPRRYVSGKQITGQKHYDLGRDSDEQSRAEVLQQILDNFQGRNSLLAHYPAEYYDADEAEEPTPSRAKAGRNKQAAVCAGGCGQPEGQCCCSDVEKLARQAAVRGHRQRTLAH